MSDEQTMICDLLSAFVDGELDATEAQAFREHLATCLTCQRDLLDQMQLAARLSTLLPR